MKSRLAIPALLAIGLLVAGPAIAGRFQDYAGSTINAPRFNRPNGSGPSTATNPVPYRAQRFVLLGPANCTIYSSQDYDGYIHLYAGTFNPSNPLANLIEGDDDAELGLFEGSSRVPQDLDSNSISLTGGVYTLVTSGFNPDDQGTFQNRIQCSGEVQPVSWCFVAGYDRTKDVCLRDRFAVVIDRVTNHPTDGVATPVRFASGDSAFFWFFNPVNYEVIVKVVNGCPINGHYWVFIAGTTNQGHRIRVGEVGTGGFKDYLRTQGPPAPAITDTNAFPCQ